MSKRFTFKSVLTLVVILLSALVLVACGDNDKEAVDTAVTGLTLPFQGSDSATNVTQNLTLPPTSGDVTITWASSHPTVITTAGVVNRPAFGQADVTVTLTATLTKGDATGEKQFTLVVKAMTQTDQQAVDAAVASLDITLQTGNTATTVTGNITLPTTVGTTTVAWSSSNTAVVSNAGVVTRPAAGLNNAVVTLTATVTKGAATGTKTFTVTVLAHPVIVTDQDAVNEALNVLNIGLASGNTLANITANVTLPATQNTLTVIWTSSNTAVVSNAGVVTRPGKGMAAVTVTLTAEISKGIAFGSKTFTLTVQPEPYTAEDVLDAIAITGDTLTYNADTDRYTTTTNIVLPTNLLGIPIVWSSPNPAVITAEGVVTRPAYGQNDSTVILTATILEEDFTFIVTVPAITVKPVSLILSEAYDSLLLAGIANGVASDLTLPTTVGTEGVTVTWASSNTAVITNLGVVTRQPEHTSVILTATLHLSGQQLTKEFEVVVLRFADFHEVANLQEAIEWFQTGVSPDPEVPINYYVKIPGVTIFGRTSEGFMFGDATGMSFAYTASAPNPNWIVGNVYDFYGLADFFNGNIQFNGVKSVSQPIQMLPSNAEVTVLTPTVVTDIEAFIASLPTAYPDKSTPLVHQYIQLTAKVRYQSSDNYHTMFVNPSYDGPDINTAAQSPFTTNALIVYYRSNKADLVPFDGITVTVNVFLYSLRNDRNLYTVIFTGTADDIQFALSDAATVDLAGESVTAPIPTEILEDTMLNLPTAAFGTTISWASSNTSVIDPESGEVVVPATGQVTVTLTATITKGDVTKDFVVTIKVGELEILTVAEVLALSSGTVRMHVTVTGMTTYRTFAIQDETGAMAVFYQNATADQINTWLGYVGKEIEIIGVRGAFGGLQQIVLPFTVTVLGDGTVPAPVNIDEVALTVEGLTPYRSMFVTRTGLEVIGKPSQSFGNVLLNLQDPDTLETINIFWDSRVAVVDGNIATFEIGDTVNLIGVPLGWSSNLPRFEYTKSSQIVKVEYVPTTDQEKADAAADALIALPANVTSNVTLTLESTGLYGTTVTWSSSNTDVITDAGVVTVPFDAVSVTMTATVTLNDATATKEFVINVSENVLTVAAARALAAGQVVIIEGLVTSIAVATDGRVVAFLEDDTAGIYLYKVAAADASKVVVGNIIRVYGTTAVYENLIQITTFTNIVVVSTENPVVPTVVTDPALIATMQGELVQVSGYLRQLYTTGSDYFLVTDQGQFRLRLASSSDLAATPRTAITTKIYNVPMGTFVTVVAGVGQFGSTMQIMLLNADDITIGTLGTDAQLLAAAVGNLVLPAESNELIANLTLPTTGLFGTTVVWGSSNEAVISTTGVVTRPAAETSNAEVTLTYTVTLNAEVFEGTLDFIVLAEEGEVLPPEEQTVTAAYPGGTTTNMTAGNNAASIGLDPLLFNVVSTERVINPLHVGLNTAGQIRLYGDANTEGNILTISIASGYTITGVKFVFGATVGNALIMTGAVQAFSGALTANGTQEFTDLSVSQFSIKNINSGTGQIYILSIEITYIQN